MLCGDIRKYTLDPFVVIPFLIFCVYIITNSSKKEIDGKVWKPYQNY